MYIRKTFGDFILHIDSNKQILTVSVMSGHYLHFVLPQNRMPRHPNSSPNITTKVIKNLSILTRVGGVC